MGIKIILLVLCQSLAIQSYAVTSSPTPAPLSLSDAMQLAMTHSFQSQVEFQHLMQARNTAKASYQALLPHIGLSDILSNLIPSVTSALSVIGDVLPFLFPNRWFQARAGTYLANAENDGYLLMKLDMANQVEGLVYALARDQAILSAYQKLYPRAQAAQSLTAGIESKGGLPAGSTDNITALIDSMVLDMDDLTSLVKADEAAISASLGYADPQLVEVEIGTENIPFETAIPLVATDLIPQVLDRSLELNQEGYMIEAAQYQKRAIYFEWLDPSVSSPEADLGIALGATVAVASSQIQELQVDQSQLKFNLEKSVYSNVGSYNTAIQERATLQDDEMLEERRLNTVIAQIYPGSSINTMDVQGVFQDNLSHWIRKEGVRADFRIARAQIDRLLMQGYYVNKSSFI